MGREDRDTSHSVVLQAEDVIVRRGGRPVLDGVSLSVEQGSRTLIRGPSGAGKTTLFQVLGLLATPDAGRVLVDGNEATKLSERRRARFRRESVGLVFQEFHLIPDLTAWENAVLPQTHKGGTGDERWVAELFDRLGLEGSRDQYPATLSGGEKQRVAVARALANRPQVLLADEPTGQLDPETGIDVMDLLLELGKEEATSVVVISHDRELGERFGVIHKLVDGKLSPHKSQPGSTPSDADPETPGAT